MTLFQQIAAALNWNLRVNENFISVSPAGLYSRNPATTTGLTWGYLGGNFNGATVATGMVTLTASNTNYVVAHRTTGAVTVATTTTNWLNTVTYLQLYQIVAGTSTVTSYEDVRQAFGAPASYAGGTLSAALNEAPPVTLASAATVNIGAAAANSVTVTGTTTITAFDTIAAGATRHVTFNGILTLTYNATSLILPAGASITTAAGDVAEMVSLGGGNWKCNDYVRASGAALAGSPFTGGTLTSAMNEAPQVTLASAATVNIGAASANSIAISGTTTITAFDTIASGAVRRLMFQSSLTLTHSGTALILPGAASIATSAGDVAWMESLGAGNWRCAGYQKANGQAVVTGGAGLTNWTESNNSAAPNATVPVVVFTATNAATNVDAAIVAKGTGATLAAIPDNTATGGNKRGSNATDWGKVRNLATQVASGSTSVIGGGLRNTASGSGTTVAGGSSNTASNTDDTVCGGNTNTASGAQSFVGGGTTNNATGTSSTVAGGSTNIASGTQATVPGGFANTASGNFSTAIGSRATTRSIIGMLAHGAGLIAAQGDTQVGRYVLSSQTSNATATGIGASGQTPNANSTVVMPNNSVFDFTINVVARSTSGGATAASWKIEGTIKRDGTAATTAFIGTPTTTAKGAQGSAISVAVVANTTLGSLDVQVTGFAATTINWCALVETVEVIA